MSEEPSTAPAGLEWQGAEKRECGEHRTTGSRAWCYDCSEWCYESPEMQCKGCCVIAIEAEHDALRRRVQYLIDWANKRGHLPEHYFTFADGDTWWATGHHPWENIT